MAMPPIDANCIFCKIVTGQIPCHKIFEDEQVLAFLDINPIARGHVLVIPKGHWARLEEMPVDMAAAVGKAIPGIGRAVTAATQTPDWNLLQNNGKPAGQVVDHVHFHIIPRKPADGLGYRWPAGKLSAGDAKMIVESIAKEIKG